MGTKLTIEQVSKEFSDRNWVLLSKEYVKNILPLEAICPKGHTTTISVCNLKKGQGCKFCAGNIKYTYEEISEICQSKGIKLLAKEYKSFTLPVECECVCGSPYKTTLASIINGCLCKKCGGKKTAQKLRISDDVMKDFCKEIGLEFLESIIKKDTNRDKGRSYIKFICYCGETAEAIWDNFKRFPGCWECGKKKKSGEKCYMWNPDREAVNLNKKYGRICNQLLRRVGDC